MLQEAIAEYNNLNDDFVEHIDSKSNPHEVTAEQTGAVPKTITINSKPLNSDIELNCTDIGAATIDHIVPCSNVDAYNSNLAKCTPTSLSVSKLYLSATKVRDYALLGGGRGNSSYYSTVNA